MEGDIFNQATKSNDDSRKKQEALIRRAISENMRTPHGREFIKLINSGMSSQYLCALIMQYNESL